MKILGKMTRIGIFHPGIQPKQEIYTDTSKTAVFVRRNQYMFSSVYGEIPVQLYGITSKCILTFVLRSYVEKSNGTRQ